MSLRRYNELWDELLKLLIKEKVKFSKAEGYNVICKIQSVKFEIELMTLEDANEFSYFRIKKFDGPIDIYNKIVHSILAAIRL